MLAKYGMKLGDANGVPEKNVTILDTGAVYNATAEGKCNFGEVFTTDGRIESLDLTLLADDKKFFPEYNITPYVNSAKLKQYPQMASVYNQVSAKMTNAEMMRLNRQVDVEGREPADVAYDWMVQKGFITRA
jgi:osmoprotectant transport system substrate-binding protein